jgi:hypothetical protein
MRFGSINGFDECLQLVTTNNYNTITSLHILQIITANSKSSVFTSHCLVVTSNNAVSLPRFLCCCIFMLCHGTTAASFLFHYFILQPPYCKIIYLESKKYMKVQNTQFTCIHICFMKVYGLKNMVFRYHTCLMQVM